MRSSSTGVVTGATGAALTFGVFFQAIALLGCAGPLQRQGALVPESTDMARAENARVRDVLCADVGVASCADACSDDAPPAAHVECLLAFRFRDDEEAIAIARSLYARTGTMTGVETKGSIKGYGGVAIEVVPALPIGEDRRHLVWADASLAEFSAFVEALSPHAHAPVAFQVRPRALRFFRTREPSYPSAYGADGVVGYNLAGPLFTERETAHETLFHELFHLEDERQGNWSSTALVPVFDRIVERCGDDHECLTPYSPHDTVVPGGTYYPFDSRTRDVREYAAELALRYYREHRVLLTGGTLDQSSFKCATEENRLAWSELVETFFGGADLAPDCADAEPG